MIDIAGGIGTGAAHGRLGRPSEDWQVKDDPRGRKQAFYADLKRRVLTLRLKPGADLDEVKLATEYGLSRPPLREVLRQLAGEGYVTLRTNRGAQVSSMTYETLRTFFMVAPMIYAAVARLAAMNARPDQIAELKEVQRGFRNALAGGATEERVALNDRFHALTGEMADDVYLMPSLRRLLIDHARIGMTFYRPNRPEMGARLATAADQHDEMIACIEAGDEDGAAAVARAHWTLSRDQIESFVTPPGLDTPLGGEALAKED